jgi:hypothetical protein
MGLWTIFTFTPSLPTLDVRLRYEKDELDDEYAERMMHATSTRLRRDDSFALNTAAPEPVAFFSRCQKSCLNDEKDSANRTEKADNLGCFWAKSSGRKT